MTQLRKEDLRAVVAEMAAVAPERLGQSFETLLHVRAADRMDAADVVEALRTSIALLPGAGAEGMDQVVRDLEAALGTTAEVADLGLCGLGPALLALTAHLNGAMPHHRPGALGATPMTAATATDVLGWSRSGRPIARLVAALTADDPAIVTPLVDDEHRIVRVAAAANRCLQPSGRMPSPNSEPPDEREDDPVHGRPAFTLLRVELEEAGLVVPELARRFAEAKLLTRFDPWRTATAAWPLPFQDYMFDGMARMLRGPVPQQFAISHAGHGINSYGLNLRAAVGPVVVMGQVGWGGVYGGEEDDERWRVLAEGLDLLTHGIALTHHGRLEQRRWLVVHSNFRLGPMPTLLRFDGARWALPDDVLDQPEASRHDVRGERPTIEQLEDRWTQIHNVVEQDLFTFERDWTTARTGHSALVVPSPDDEEGDELSAVLDDDGRVAHVEYESDEGLLIRRGGIWMRSEELPEDWLTDVARLTSKEQVPIPPEIVPILDVADTIRLRPHVTSLGIEPL